MAARRLYKFWQIDHAKLFTAVAACRGDFLMSYDNTAEIVTLAKKHGFESRPIAPSNNAGKISTHLLIGKKLSEWLTN
jgi:DNA adenine methylase